jgi:hypothetical protein
MLSTPLIGIGLIAVIGTFLAIVLSRTGGKVKDYEADRDHEAHRNFRDPP